MKQKKVNKTHQPGSLLGSDHPLGFSGKLLSDEPSSSGPNDPSFMLSLRQRRLAEQSGTTILTGTTSSSSTSKQVHSKINDNLNLMKIFPEFPTSTHQTSVGGGSGSSSSSLDRQAYYFGSAGSSALPTQLGWLAAAGSAAGAAAAASQQQMSTSLYHHHSATTGYNPYAAAAATGQYSQYVQQQAADQSLNGATGAPVPGMAQFDPFCAAFNPFLNRNLD